MSAHLYDIPPDRSGWFFVSLPRGSVHPVEVLGGVGLTHGRLYVFIDGAALAVTNPMLHWHGPVPMPAELNERAMRLQAALVQLAAESLP